MIWIRYYSLDINKGYQKHQNIQYYFSIPKTLHMVTSGDCLGGFLLGGPGNYAVQIESVTLAGFGYRNH